MRSPPSWPSGTASSSSTPTRDTRATRTSLPNCSASGPTRHVPADVGDVLTMNVDEEDVDEGDEDSE